MCMLCRSLFGLLDIVLYVFLSGVSILPLSIALSLDFVNVPKVEYFCCCHFYSF